MDCRNLSQLFVLHEGFSVMPKEKSVIVKLKYDDENYRRLSMCTYKFVKKCVKYFIVEIEL